MTQLLLMLSLFSVSKTFTIRIFSDIKPAEVVISTGEATHTIKASGDALIVDGKGESYYQAMGEKRYILEAGGVRRGYSGGFTFYSSDGELYILNYVPEDTYLASVVTSEMPEGGIEARKAQAILARTYAYNTMGDYEMGYDLQDCQLSQVYRGLAADEGAVSAVRETAGLILGYKGDVADVYYHSTCGGMILLPSDIWEGASDKPYHARIVDTLCSISPLYAWEDTVRLDTLSVRLGFKQLPDSIILVRDTTFTPVKGFKFYAPDYRLYGVKETVELFPAKPITNRFDIEIKGDLLIIHGHGYGHGVGMCQFGAMAMASHGGNYRDILTRFFPGTEIMSVSRLGD